MRWFRSDSRTPSSPTSLSKREAVWKKTGGYCWYCGEALAWESFHIEHQEPRKLGGSNELDNLVPSCPPCNYRKSKDRVEVFREREIERGNLSPGRKWIPHRGPPKFPGERGKKK
jgi:5-methylcytosine-specific restriction endonuclease McrA